MSNKDIKIWSQIFVCVSYNLQKTNESKATRQVSSILHYPSFTINHLSFHKFQTTLIAL